jgi:preprotein translocase subunit YajC
MSLLTFLQAASETVANATAETIEQVKETAATIADKTNEVVNTATNAMATTDEPPQGSGWTIWVMLGLIFVVMYFFMIRPQKKQQKEIQRFRDSLAKGDKVVTIGGIFGTVTEIKEDSVLIEVDNGVKIRVSKQALVKDFTDPARQ